MKSFASHLEMMTNRCCLCSICARVCKNGFFYFVVALENSKQKCEWICCCWLLLLLNIIIFFLLKIHKPTPELLIYSFEFLFRRPKWKRRGELWCYSYTSDTNRRQIVFQKQASDEIIHYCTFTYYLLIITSHRHNSFIFVVVVCSLLTRAPAPTIWPERAKKKYERTKKAANTSTI